MNKDKIIQILKSALFLLAMVFLLAAVYYTWAEFKKGQYEINWAYFGLSSLFALGFFILQALGWRWLVNGMGHQMPLGPSLHTWFFSQVVKYVPGKVMLPLYRSMYAARLGVATGRTLLSIAVELVIMTASAGLVFLALLPFLSKGVENVVSLPLLVACCIAGLIGIHPKIINFGVNMALKMAKRDPVTIEFSYFFLLRVLAFYVLAWLAYGLSAFFNVLAVADLWAGPNQVYWTVTGAFTLAWLIGFLSFLTPGGVGVREGILYVGLQGFVPKPVAVAISISSRLVWIIGEIAGAGLTLYWQPKVNSEKEAGDE